LLTHLKLKGNCIRGLNDPTLYLDGDAFGITRQDPDGNHIGLRIPQSGDGKRGGDFEMWFWLVLPVTLTGLNFSPNPVTVTPTAAVTATGTLALVGTQLTAGNTIALSAQAIDPTGKPIPGSIATVPASITLGTSANPTFTVTNINLPPGIGAATLEVTATYGSSSAQGSLNITTQISVSKVSFSPASVIGSATASLTVTLNVSAPAGGALITLSSNAVAQAGVAPAATVPASVTIPAGQTSVTVGVPTLQRTNTFVLQVTATFNGTATGSLTITAPIILEPTPVPIVR
jgi:hypothetical protein